MADSDPDLVAEEQGNPERPEWLPENFKSPEDLAKSYAESQRKITELANEKKGLEESVQSLAAQFEEFTAAQNRPDPNQIYSQWEDRYNQDPISTMAEIAAATANQILQQQAQQNQQPAASPDVVAFIADQTMAQKAEDWGAYREKVGELVAQNPLFQRDELWASPQSAAQALESAYQMVKAQDVLSGNEIAQQQAADTRAMKLGAQSAVGASGRPPAPSSDAEEWARIRDAAPKRYYE